MIFRQTENHTFHSNYPFKVCESSLYEVTEGKKKLKLSSQESKPKNNDYLRLETHAKGYNTTQTFLQLKKQSSIISNKQRIQPKKW